MRDLLGEKLGSDAVGEVDIVFHQVGLSELLHASSKKVFDRLYYDAVQRLRRLEERRFACLEEIKEVTIRLIEAQHLFSKEKELFVGQPAKVEKNGKSSVAQSILGPRTSSSQVFP